MSKGTSSVFGIVAWSACAGTLVGSSALGAPPVAQDADISELRQTIVELQQRVETSNDHITSLQNQVTDLQREAGEQWLSEARADEIRTLVQDVLADADMRASLLSDGATAGWDNGFFIGSADGTFRLNIGGQLQVRYIVNSREDDNDIVDGWESGFQMRRMKLTFSGHIGTPKLTYIMQLAANRNTTTVELEDALIAYQLDDAWRIWGGRFMDVFSREQMMSSKRQQTIDRSAVANIFAANDGYVEGVGLQWHPSPDPDFLRLTFTVNDGMNSGTAGGTGTGFQNAGNDFNNDSTDFAATARADIKIAGDWKQNADVESWSNSVGPHVFFGAGLHYEAGETGDGQSSAWTPQTGSYDDFFQWTVDAMIKYHGLGVTAAFYGWHFNATDGNFIGDTDHYAATAQAGYMVIPDTLEPYIRYEWIDVDRFTNELQFVTLGFNWFFNGHSAKFSADVVWALDNVNSTNTLGTGLTGIGILNDAFGEEDQVVGRLQFQLLF